MRHEGTHTQQSTVLPHVYTKEGLRYWFVYEGNWGLIVEFDPECPPEQRGVWAASPHWQILL